jgi:hypothetical protein
VSTTDPLYVVAKDYTAYINWCQAKGYPPHNGTVIYVRGIQTLAALRSDVRHLFLYGWTARKDAKAIHSRMSIIGRRPS